MNTRPDNIRRDNSRFDNTGFDGVTPPRLATEYRPLLLRIWLGAVLVTFTALEFCIHHRGEALRAAGYNYWSATGYYIRYVPGHLLSLTQAQSHIWILIAALFAGLFVAALVGCVLTPNPIFVDLNRVSSRSSGKPLLRGRVCKLAFAILPLIIAGISGLIGLDIVNTITVDLDQRLITGPAGVDSYCMALSTATGFNAVLATSPDGKSSHWEVRAQRINGHYFILLDIEFDFSNDQRVALLIAGSLNDFVTSHGQTLPSYR